MRRHRARAACDRIRPYRGARRPLPRWKAEHRAARVMRRAVIHLAGKGEGRQMRTWRQPIFRELVPEVLNYSRGGTAATAVTRPSVSREHRSRPGWFGSLPLRLSVAALIELLAGRHYVSRGYKDEARRS